MRQRDGEMDVHEEHKGYGRNENGGSIRRKRKKSWIRPLLWSDSVRFHVTQTNSLCHAMPCLFEGTGEEGQGVYTPGVKAVETQYGLKLLLLLLFFGFFFYSGNRKIFLFLSLSQNYSSHLGSSCLPLSAVARLVVISHCHWLE